MTKYLLSLFLSLSLLTVSAVPFTAYAQTDTGPGLQSPGREGISTMDDGGVSTTDENTFEPGVGGGPGDMATNGRSDNGLSWLWLLPLLAIPVLYFMWRSSDETATSRGYRE